MENYVTELIAGAILALWGFTAWVLRDERKAWHANSAHLKGQLEKAKERLATLTEERTDELKNLPGFITLGDSCKECTWVEAYVTPPGEPQAVKNVCTECGAIRDTQQALNAIALENLIKSQTQAVKARALEKVVGKRLDFEMTRFFDAWLRQNKKDLVTLLEDSSQYEALENLLTTFLNQGNLAAQQLTTEIVKELEEKNAKAKPN